MMQYCTWMRLVLVKALVATRVERAEHRVGRASLALWAFPWRYSWAWHCRNKLVYSSPVTRVDPLHSRLLLQMVIQNFKIILDFGVVYLLHVLQVLFKGSCISSTIKYCVCCHSLSYCCNTYFIVVFLIPIKIMVMRNNPLAFINSLISGKQTAYPFIIWHYTTQSDISTAAFNVYIPFFYLSKNCLILYFTLP